MASSNTPSFGEDNVLEGFKFGSDNGMWLTKSRKKKKFLAFWSVGTIFSDDSTDQNVDGFIKIKKTKKGKSKIKIYHDVDDNTKLDKKDELIGSLRVGKGFDYSNDFGFVAFKADAIGTPVDDGKIFEFSYYFNLIPSEADSDVKTVKIPVSSDFLDEQNFVGRNEMTVSDFESMVVDTF